MRATLNGTEPMNKAVGRIRHALYRPATTLMVLLGIGLSIFLSFAALLSEGASTSIAVAGASTGTSEKHLSGAAPSGGCNGSWGVVSSPSPGGGDHSLLAVDALSTVDAWTVGSYSLQFNSPRQTLIEHWNGTNWSVVPSPSPGGTGNSLQGVSAAASNDVWAVGQYYQSDQVRHPLILHWDGSTWNLVASPIADGGLRDVTVISASDVWAIGTSNGPLTIHWDGAMWSVVVAPHPAINILTEVSGTASDDVWAVGYELNQAQTQSSTFIIHWNGTAWSVVPSPNTASIDNYLYGVDAISSNDVWAVGYHCCTPTQPLAMHWDGVSWTIVPLPVQGRAGLNDVAAVSSNDVWAVGVGATDGVSEARAYHWNGSQWTLVPTEPAGNDYIVFEGVTTLATFDVWGVGTYRDPNSSHLYTLIEHFTDACPSPTPTSTRPTATATRTSTPTATPPCGFGWNLVGAPNVGLGHNLLTGVTTVSANDIWASGYHSDNMTGIAQTLTEHWDGAQWSVVASPNTGTMNNYLYGIEAISATDIWAVGLATTASGNQTLTLHWDGTAWSVVPSPNPPGEAELRAVSALASNNVWAVGSVGPTNNRTLAMHWDGTVWSLSNPPSVGTRENYLYAVEVLPDNSVWAVGYYYNTNPGGNRALALTWNGGTWSVIPTPGYIDSMFYGIAGLAANDIWVVGRRYDFAGRFEVLALHWDGFQWGGTPISGPGTVTNVLYGASALSSGDVWAVGFAESGGGIKTTLTEHWDGTGWSVVASPNAGFYANQLLGIAPVSSNDLWAVGSYRPDASSFERNLVERYADPCITPTPTPTAMTSSTAAVTVTETATATTTSTNIPLPTQTPGGPSATAQPTNTSTGTSTRTATARPTNTATPTGTTALGITPTRTNTATAAPTQTTISPSSTTEATGTRTQSPPTSTPGAATPSPCALQYTDVPPGNTFYSFVRCLACRGIISGYPCGGEGEPCDGDNNPYFRPNVNVTRGQIAKIVSNSAGYNEDPNPQIYEDVSSANIFFIWINRLSRRGHMGGYPCGGDGEPCGADNKPYFRPFNNATRGQLAKIVSNAAGFSDVPGGQIFADVPSENSFYAWIQRLASRAIMGGYQCGGEGEPCDSQQRPYFRPFNNVSRGQTAKIVSGAFFPNCQAPTKR